MGNLDAAERFADGCRHRGRYGRRTGVLPGGRRHPGRNRREDPPPLLADLDCAVPDLIRCSASVRALSSQSVHPGHRSTRYGPTSPRAGPSANSAPTSSVLLLALCSPAPPSAKPYPLWAVDNRGGPRGRRPDRGDRECRDVRRHRRGERWRCPHSRRPRSADGQPWHREHHHRAGLLRTRLSPPAVGAGPGTGRRAILGRTNAHRRVAV
jgi:hypothetical protein